VREAAVLHSSSVTLRSPGICGESGMLSPTTREGFCIGLAKCSPSTSILGEKVVKITRWAGEVCAGSPRAVES
jgi:hypothetical protein